MSCHSTESSIFPCSENFSIVWSVYLFAELLPLALGHKVIFAFFKRPSMPLFAMSFLVLLAVVAAASPPAAAAEKKQSGSVISWMGDNMALIHQTMRKENHLKLSSTLLGRGAFSFVYKGRNHRGKSRAFKISAIEDEIHIGENQPSLNGTKMFFQEVHALNALKTSNRTVKFYGWHELFVLNRRIGVIEMELIKGKTVMDYVLETKPISMEAMLWILHQNVMVAKEIHSYQLYHHDLNLKNMLVTKRRTKTRGTKRKLVAIDFGLTSYDSSPLALRNYETVPSTFVDTEKRQRNSSPHDFQQFCHNWAVMTSALRVRSFVFWDIFYEYCVPVLSNTLSFAEDDFSVIEKELQQTATNLGIHLDKLKVKHKSTSHLSLKKMLSRKLP